MDDPFSSSEQSPPPLERIIEAMLFIGGAPLSIVRACESVRGLTANHVGQAIAQLNKSYREQGRPYRIESGAQGYELTLRPQFRMVRERLFGTQRETRLSQLALDTLAIVAYQQPVTRQEVDSLRGGDSLSQLRQLVRLGLIAVQRGQASQTEICYVTTPRFLRLFGLQSLDDLPRTMDLQKM